MQFEKLTKRDPLLSSYLVQDICPRDSAGLRNKPLGCGLPAIQKDRDELAQVYASADLMLHGSAAETFGLGVAEAICSGLPVIGPSVGGAADLVSEGCGLLYEPGDSSECAEKTLEALDRSHDAWQSALARRAQDINTVDQHFEQLFHVYQQLIDDRS